MDTKSKNIRYTAWIKLLAVLLCLIGPLAAAWGLLQVYNFRYVPYGDDYLKSGDFMNDITQCYYRVHQAVFGEEQSPKEPDGLPGGISYWARLADGAVLTNIPEGSDPDGYFSGLNGRFLVNADSNSEFNYLADGIGSLYYYPMPPEGAVLYVGMSQELLSRNADQFHANRMFGIQGVYLLGAGLLVLLLGMAWLVYTAGRRPGVEGAQLLGVDHVYLDIGFAAAVIAVTFCSFGLFFFYDKVFHAASINRDAAYVMIGLLAECISVTLMLWLTSAARRFKRRELIKHTLIHAVLSWIARYTRQALGAGTLAVKAVLLFAAYAAMSCLMFLAFAELVQQGYQPFAAFLAFMAFVAINAAAIVYILRKMAALRQVLSGIDKIRAGNLAHRIPETGGAPFGELAASINGIAEGLGAAVENEVKAERMKAELITNVSHDLKTPLTSIITYIDLLKTEGPGSENAAGYIGVLDAKARRLKALTDDLFEAAKAASGNIKPNLERLDVGELIEQGLGELTDRIRESGLDFRFAPPERQLFVMADGKLLWRVMENLFSNVFKYALAASRVYISAACVAGRVVISVKNISSAELNMPAEALLERFARGDASRHSEGSGLGLAIAKSLVELQGGRFFLEIDGDLFKASLDFNEAV